MKEIKCFRVLFRERWNLSSTNGFLSSITQTLCWTVVNKRKLSLKVSMYHSISYEHSPMKWSWALGNDLKKEVIDTVRLKETSWDCSHFWLWCLLEASVEMSCHGQLGGDGEPQDRLNTVEDLNISSGLEKPWDSSGRARGCEGWIGYFAV